VTNLTIVIDEDLLRAARIKALQEGTSVNEICREAITRYAAPAKNHAQWMRQLRELQAAVRADRLLPDAPAPEPMWPSREAMYDEIEAERMPTLFAKLAADEAAREVNAEPSPKPQRRPAR